MRKIGIVGIIILFTGILAVVYFSPFSVQPKELSVVKHYADDVCRSIAECDLPMEELVINVPARVSLEESAIIEIRYQQSGLYDREVTVETSGTNFKISPSSAVSRRVGDASERWVWVVSPEKLGKHSLVLQFSGISSALLNDNQQGHSAIIYDDAMKQQVNNLEYRFTTNEPIVYTIEVIDTFGLSLREGRFLGYITSFLGSALSFPWLYSIWEKRREQKSKTEMETLQKEHQQKIDELEKQIKDREEKRKKNKFR